MNDLLGSVKGAGGSGTRPVYDIEAGAASSATAQQRLPPSQAEKPRDMEEFFLRVDDVKASIGEIKAKHREIQRMHEQSKTIVRKNEMQQHRSDMQVRVSAAALLRGGSHDCKCGEPACQ
jgi:hypothetical protein